MSTLLRLLFGFLAGQAALLWSREKRLRDQMANAQGWDKVSVLFRRLVSANKQLLETAGVSKDTITYGEESIEAIVGKAHTLVQTAKEELVTSSQDVADRLLSRADTLLETVSDRVDHQDVSSIVSKLRDEISALRTSSEVSGDEIDAQAR